MKKYETSYDKYGWKIIITTGKDATQIYLRSKGGHHRAHKPFYLRLSKENLLQLVRLLKKAIEKEQEEN